MAIILQRKPPSLLHKIYLWNLLKNMGITAKQAIKDYWARLKHTVPQNKTTLNRNLRQEHRLVLQSDGSPLCNACQLCAKACPSNCICVEPPPPSFAFTIDLSLCLSCGTCVEACPWDAIRMDGKRDTTNTQQKKNLAAILL